MADHPVATAAHIAESVPGGSNAAVSAAASLLARPRVWERT